MPLRKLALGMMLVAACLLVVPQAALAKDPQLAPKRLSSTGDSITEAIDAELPLANHWASYVNGYTNFWTWLFGYTNVYSHNQRISANFGSRNRKNYIRGVSGADSYDFPGQSAQAVGDQATYVTVLMGHNDVCQNSFAEIPTDAQYEANMRAGMNNLKNGLPNGATVYVIGIVDIYQLWALGDQLDALGFLPCKVLWATTLVNLFPCGTMLNPLNSEADRQFTRSRNIAFNTILENLTAEFEATDSHHHYVYSDVVFNTPFVPSEVSSIDCFHPSATGQTRLADVTWDDGPFWAYQN